MLQVQSIHTFYGLSHILFDVSLSVAKGEIVCLLGRNGAGKEHHHEEHHGLDSPAAGNSHVQG